MSYLTQDTISFNAAMYGRITMAAADEGVHDPDSWAASNRRTWAAAPGWDAAWESSLAGHPNDPAYDPGADEAVITDGMILSQVQAMLGAAQPK